MTFPRLDISLSDLGCQEITNDTTPRGQRDFQCAWDDRFKVAHSLVMIFGNIEINGVMPMIEDDNGTIFGFHYAKITGGVRIEA